MKNTLTRSLAMTLALVLPLPSFSQSSACDPIKNAAQAGRDQANNRSSALEKNIYKQVEKSRNCLEAFGDAGSRQAMLLGGFDLAPLRNALMDQACAVVQREVNAAMPTLPSGLTKIADQAMKAAANSNSGYGGGNTGYGGASTATPTYSPVGTSSSTSSTAPGLWDRLSCKVAGNC